MTDREYMWYGKLAIRLIAHEIMLYYEYRGRYQLDYNRGLSRGQYISVKNMINGQERKAVADAIRDIRLEKQRAARAQRSA